MKKRKIHWILIVGLVVTDAIVVVNREQGGAAYLQKNGIQMHSLFTLTELMKILEESGRIDEQIVQNVQKYLAETQVNFDMIGLFKKRYNFSFKIKPIFCFRKSN